MNTHTHTHTYIYIYICMYVYNTVVLPKKAHEGQKPHFLVVTIIFNCFLLNYCTPQCTAAHITWMYYYNGFLLFFVFFFYFYFILISSKILVYKKNPQALYELYPRRRGLVNIKKKTIIYLVIFRIDH